LGSCFGVSAQPYSTIHAINRIFFILTFVILSKVSF
jgi:hypothetical protein